MNFTIRPITDTDRPWVLETIRGWGADFVVSRGRKILAADLPGFIAEGHSQVGRIQPVSGGLDKERRSGCSQPDAGRCGHLPATKKIGLLTYEIIGDQCEVVTLDAFTQFSGIGTELMKHAAAAARVAGCVRLWLITTNDNIDAIRFYQKRGMTIAAVHVGAIAESRKLKPTIPEIGTYGIPVRDEIEFEMEL